MSHPREPIQESLFPALSAYADAERVARAGLNDALLHAKGNSLPIPSAPALFAIALLVTGLAAVGTSADAQNPAGSARGAGLANPASQNCVDKGGTVTIEKNGKGDQFGVCTFPDNLQCEEWAMVRGRLPHGWYQGDRLRYAGRALLRHHRRRVQDHFRQQYGQRARHVHVQERQIMPGNRVLRRHVQPRVEPAHSGYAAIEAAIGGRYESDPGIVRVRRWQDRHRRLCQRRRGAA